MDSDDGNNLDDSALLSETDDRDHNAPRLSKQA